jgi:RNA 2',3'-cyclic 3'-phosphodiesterase
LLDLGMPPQRPKRVPASPCRDVLFFAVLPAPAAAACIAQRAEGLRNQYGLRGRRRPTKLLHVTLHPVGAYFGLPSDVLSAAVEVGSSVEVAPFEVTFDRVLSFRGTDRHPLVLRCSRGIAEMVTLQKALGAAMLSIGLGSGNRLGFTPHVTLLYDRQSVPESGIGEPIAGWCANSFSFTASMD